MPILFDARKIANACRGFAACVIGMIGFFNNHPAASGQCASHWQPFSSTNSDFPGVTGIVKDIAVWDRDGSGPMKPKLIVGGNFTLVGNTRAVDLAVYDQETGDWSPFAEGTLNEPDRIDAVTVTPTGNVVVAGWLRASNRVSVWSGESWIDLGNWINGSVLALAVLPNGDIVAGGTFTTVGTVRANGIARWNGSSWQPFGLGVRGQSTPLVDSLAVMPNGDLIVGGWFTHAGDIPANCIARWDGDTWSVLGTGMNSTVNSLLVLPNGDLVAGGSFSTAGGLSANGIARWNGSLWATLGSGMTGESTRVEALASLPDGGLIAGGFFATAGGVQVQNVARWNGSTWTPTGSGMNGPVTTFAVIPQGDVFAGGWFTRAGGNGVSNLARGDGTSWSPIGSALYSSVVAMDRLPDGGLVVATDRINPSGTVSMGVLRWNGTNWSALGSGVDSGSIRTLKAMPNGDIVAGGSFTAIGGVPARRIARWNGTAWSAMGSGFEDLRHNAAEVRTLALLPNGNLVVGGYFDTAGGLPANCIAVWDDIWWSSLPAPGAFVGSIESLAVASNGDIIAAGRITPGNIARWNGAWWYSLGSGLNNTARAVTMASNGDIVVAGEFTNAGGLFTQVPVARWNGTVWSVLGSGITSSPIDEIATLPNGNIVASGNFAFMGGAAANYIARWNGSSWSAMGPGLNSRASDIVALPNGDIIVSGGFTAAGTTVTPGIALYSAIPIVLRQPESRSISQGQTIELVARPSHKMVGVSARWYRDGLPITNGPAGASPNGGTVTGASFTLPSPTDGTPAVLIIDSARRSDAGQYTVVFSNPCGSITSNPATVTIRPGCPADLNNDGSTDLADFFAFFNCYDTNQPCADIDGTPGTDLADFFLFFASYDAGC